MFFREVGLTWTKKTLCSYLSYLKETKNAHFCTMWIWGTNQFALINLLKKKCFAKKIKQNVFYQQNFLPTKCFQQNFLSKKFSTNKIFCPQNFLPTKFFTNKIFYQQNFLPTKCFQQNYLPKKFSTNKTFCQQNFLPTKFSTNKTWHVAPQEKLKKKWKTLQGMTHMVYSQDSCDISPQKEELWQAWNPPSTLNPGWNWEHVHHSISERRQRTWETVFFVFWKEKSVGFSGHFSPQNDYFNEFQVWEKKKKYLWWIQFCVPERALRKSQNGIDSMDWPELTQEDGKKKSFHE